jgi:hypothetical protein
MPLPRALLDQLLWRLHDQYLVKVNEAIAAERPQLAAELAGDYFDAACRTIAAHPS